MVQPPSKLDSFPSDGIPPFKYALTATAVDIGRGEVMKALVVTPGVVAINELGVARFQLTGQVVVLEQDLVLHGAVVALDLALGHRVIGLASGVRHAMFSEPRSELSGNVGGPIIAQQPRAMPEPDAVQAGTAQRDRQGVGDIGEVLQL